jgi:catechol 2,3-dioxygenase-like lactoylglutathione lyase family enzyme
MNDSAISIRPFIGAKNYDISRNFYKDLGFREKELFPNMCLFYTDRIAFYLQKAYVEDWVNNSMVFVEVKDVDSYWKELEALGLPLKYEHVKITPVKTNDWGKECFVHDPSGILWHFGQFNTA